MYELLFSAFELVERIGPVLVPAAWFSVLLAVIGMARALRGRLRAHRLAFGLVLAVSLAAHLLDFFLTLSLTPDLALEANPVWKLAVQMLGLAGAKWYGFTGKVLVAVLEAQLFAWYLVAREGLFPTTASSLGDFTRRFGEPAQGRLPWRRLAVLFAFQFGLLGPYFFYVSLLNAVGSGDDAGLYHALPSPVPTIGLYLLVLALLFVLENYRAFRRRQA